MAKCEWTGIDCPIAASYGCYTKARADRLFEQRSLLPDKEQDDEIETAFFMLAQDSCTLEKAYGKELDAREITTEKLKLFHSWRFQIGLVVRRLGI